MTSPSVPTPPSCVQDLYDATFQHAVVQAAATMQKPEYTGRLQKAMDFVLTGAVTLQDDGTASVKSGSHTYHLEPECPCQESQTRSLSCTHYLAVQLLKRTYERLYQPVKGHGPVPQEKAPQSAAWAVHEAPASCCLKFQLNGIEIMYTMRDTGDEALFPRVKRVLSRLQDKMGQGGQEGNGQEHSQDTQDPYCNIHDVPLKKYTKEGRAWLSHYDNATNAWCRGK
jgi:hypothetical protein